MIVPALTRFCGFPLKRAIGTSLVTVAVLAVPGTVTHAALGHIDWQLAVLLSLGVVPGALLGARLARSASDSRIRLAFAGLLVVRRRVARGQRDSRGSGGERADRPRPPGRLALDRAGGGEGARGRGLRTSCSSCGPCLRGACASRHAGEAALLGRWRAHLGLCAVLGLWCSSEPDPVSRRAICATSRAVQGFSRLLGPLVPEEAVGPYLDAGLERLERILALRLESPRIARLAPGLPAGVTVRTATPPDLPAVLACDAAAFDDFWRYDEASLSRYARSERLAVAERDGRLIGYTLATVRAGEGSLGRLAVAQDERGHGVGRALVCEAARWMAESGARAVTLSTQETNESSRRLYASLGFRQLPGALVSTVSEPLPTP